jgi:hypothetical protein
MRIFASCTVTTGAITFEGQAQLGLVQVWSTLHIGKIMSEAALISFAAMSLLKELAHFRLAQLWGNTVLEFCARHVSFY